MKLQQKNVVLYEWQKTYLKETAQKHQISESELIRGLVSIAIGTICKSFYPNDIEWKYDVEHIADEIKAIKEGYATQFNEEVTFEAKNAWHIRKLLDNPKEIPSASIASTF